MSVISFTGFANRINAIGLQEKQTKFPCSFSLGSSEVKKLCFNTPEDILLNPFSGRTHYLRLFPEFHVSFHVFLLMEGMEREKAPLLVAGTLTFQGNQRTTGRMGWGQKVCGMLSCSSLEDGFLVTERRWFQCLLKKGYAFNYLKSPNSVFPIHTQVDIWVSLFWVTLSLKKKTFPSPTIIK